MKMAMSTDRTTRSRLAIRPTSHRRIDAVIALIPVQPDLLPGEAIAADGCEVDVEGGTMMVSMERSSPIAEQVVVGASRRGEPMRYATMSLESQHRLDDQMRLVLRPRAQAESDPLSADGLAPRLDPDTLRFRHRHSPEVLAAWEAEGVMRRYLVDRVLACECGSVPTWRQACPKCHSARYQRDRLIHHFACAHVDRAAAFQDNDGALACPKCGTRGLTAGVDYQYLAGPIDCFDCGHRGCQPQLSCLCHQCLRRFDPQEAIDFNVHGYHVDRLDFLDFVASRG